MLHIMCGGKLKEPFFREAEAMYRKRIATFHPIDVRENVSFSPLSRGEHVVLLDERGVRMDSAEFASFLNDVILHHKRVFFYIGGYAGFTPAERKQADTLLSLSDMTFPYQLCRIVLLEQIYRAFTVIRGMDYQK
jgi:23S rRNA (pseudouridine1915-N3)-methyltransferase